MRKAIGVYCEDVKACVSLWHCMLYKACPNDNEPIGCPYAGRVIYEDDDL